MSRRRKLTIVIASIIVVILGVILVVVMQKWLFGSSTSQAPQGTQGDSLETQDIEIVADRLTIPWGVAFMPGGDILLTERTGILRRISPTQQLYDIPDVLHIGEGGLLGIALHPEFESNHWLYLYLTTESGNGFTNRVERFRYVDGELETKETVIDGIPGARYHDGGRIAFGPDGYLYITTGDAGNEQLAQNLESLAGKILRLNDDGSIPDDNPFSTPVYSYGHRNPQGIAWDNQGRMWSTEHGRSGVRSGFDELNQIEAGANYGWPVIQGDEQREGMRLPAVHSGPTETWAPAGLAYWDGSLYFAGLAGGALYEVDLTSGNELNVSFAHLRGEYGRLRAVVVHDDQLYITTSNRDGRGSPIGLDDRLLRVNPAVL